VALLALVLVLSGGTAYAAKQKLPKNSVASKQVKNGSLQGKDFRDGTVTGADIADGSIGRPDFAAGVVSDTRLLLVTDTDAPGSATVFEDPALGTITFTCNGSVNFTVAGSLPATATPGSVKAVGQDMADNMPFGAGTLIQSTPGAPGGSVGFGGPNDLVGAGFFFYDTATKRASLQWNANTGTTCQLRGELVVTQKGGPGSGAPRQAPAGQAPKAVCDATGAVTCVAD
jgi:hypothetical protein